MPVDQQLVRRVWQHLRARDTRPRPQLPAGRGELKVVDALADPDGGAYAELWIYDEIGMWGIPATDVVARLLMIGAPTIHVHINSPGGDFFDGLAIYNALMDHPATIAVTVDALAASAASFIAMAGDTITMNRGSQMMIHDASGLTLGNEADHLEMASVLGRVSDEMAAIYAARGGGDQAGWRALMRAETWYSAGEAVSAGLADTTALAAAEQQAEAEVAARFDLNLTSFMYAGRAHAPTPGLGVSPPAGPAPIPPIPPIPAGSGPLDPFAQLAATLGGLAKEAV